VEKEIVVRGTLSDERHVELHEAVSELTGEVEVVLRGVTTASATPMADILDFIVSLPPGTRTKEDIDQSLHAERDAWEDR
jgi:hypothetical protein